MGNILNRSITQGEIKSKKSKQKRYPPTETLFESNAYLIFENKDPQIYYYENFHEKWDKKFDVQQQRINDDVEYQVNSNGISSNYSTDQYDIINQTWRSSENSNYTVHPMNAFPIISSSHNSQQFNQPKIITHDESSTKKILSPSNQQFIPLKPISSTQSWHDLSQLPVSMNTSKSIPSNSRSSTSRTSADRLTLSKNCAPIEKPIYIEIDFRATVAGRCQKPTNKHRRTRSQTNHPQRKSIPMNSSEMNVEIKRNKSNDFQPFIRISPSTSKSEQKSEIKSTKSRSHHRQQQLPINDNQTKSTKIRQHKRSRHQEQHSINVNSSAMNIQSPIQQINKNAPGIPLMRIPLSPLNHHQKKQQLEF